MQGYAVPDAASARAITGFFQQLAPGGQCRGFVRVDLAGRNFQETRGRQVTVLALQNQLAVCRQGQDGNRAGCRMYSRLASAPSGSNTLSLCT
jgi:hypothetical protein